LSALDLAVHSQFSCQLSVKPLGMAGVASLGGPVGLPWLDQKTVRKNEVLFGLT